MNIENKLKIDDFTKALAECINQAQCAVVDPMAHAEIWKEKLLELAKGKEPVSEDLEEAIEDAMPDANWYIEENNDTTGEDAYNSIQMGNMFKAGAKWQKQKDEKALNENALLYNARLEGVEIGKAEMKQQMMKDAVTAEVRMVEDFMGTTSFRCICDKYKIGDKVKLIILKED